MIPAGVLAQTPLNPEIQIGLIQRFGDEEKDKLVLTPLTGDTLTVNFETGGQPQTLTTQELTILIGDRKSTRLNSSH